MEGSRYAYGDCLGILPKGFQRENLFSFFKQIEPGKVFVDISPIVIFPAAQESVSGLFTFHIGNRYFAVIRAQFAYFGGHVYRFFMKSKTSEPCFPDTLI